MIYYIRRVATVTPSQRPYTNESALRLNPAGRNEPTIGSVYCVLYYDFHIEVVVGALVRSNNNRRHAHVLPLAGSLARSVGRRPSSCFSLTERNPASVCPTGVPVGRCSRLSSGCVPEHVCGSTALILLSSHPEQSIPIYIT